MAFWVQLCFYNMLYNAECHIDVYYIKQASSSSLCFRNQQQQPFILFTTLKTVCDFPTQK